MKEKVLLYLIGQPGAGKTTLMERALGGIAHYVEDKPFARTVYQRGDQIVAIQLGKKRDQFGGTDALGMAVQPAVIEWLKSNHGVPIIAEGDRLGNDKFFEAVQRLGYKLHVIYLQVNGDFAAARRRERGSTQNATWLKGRETKVRRLALRWTEPGWTISGDRPIDGVIKSFRRHPVIKQIRGE